MPNVGASACAGVAGLRAVQRREPLQLAIGQENERAEADAPTAASTTRPGAGRHSRTLGRRPQARSVGFRPQALGAERAVGPRARLPEGSAQAHQGGGRPRVGVVLYVDDLAVLQPEGLRPSVTLPVCARPGERGHCAVAARLDGIESVVAVAEHPSLRYPSGENLTGLVRAASGRRPPEAPQPASAPPLHVGVDQRDERLDVTVIECLIRRAKRVNGHPDSVLPSCSLHTAGP
jgi:hypothetical protein